MPQHQAPEHQAPEHQAPARPHSPTRDAAGAERGVTANTGAATPGASSAIAAAQAVADVSSGDPMIDTLYTGSHWSGAVSFSFPDSPADYEANITEATGGFQQVSALQMQAARAALTGIPGGGDGTALRGMSVAAFTLLPLRDAGADGADIRLGQTGNIPTALGYYPSSHPVGGDVWFGNAYAGTPQDLRYPVLGNYAYLTVLHELGHALGLKHAHDHGGFANAPVPAARDSLEYTVMTYRSYVGAAAGGGYTFGPWDAPQSYMMLDIAALQALYGANYDLNAGDTQYSWNPATGEMSVDGQPQGAPGGGGANRVFLTIWDGGGSDTYDLSNYGGGSQIDLNPGAASVTAGNQRAFLGGPEGIQARGTVFNALLHQGDARSLIENARGSQGADSITGNAAANRLAGQEGDDAIAGAAGDDILLGEGGDDTLDGGAGNDWLDGGAGTDTAVLPGNFLRGGDAAHLESTPRWDAATGLTVLTEQVSGAARGAVEADSLAGIEVLRFADGAIPLGGQPLLDPFFYAARNPDVFRAGLSAEAHYAGTGWREGRDPSAFFSTAPYLSANPDLRAAGIDPLGHFNAAGWREERDPRADFDTRLYQIHNPDVAAAGLNPLQHWAEHGQAEGRPRFAAVGEALRGGFDREFYLLANPDVGLGGQDALAHYGSHGWREGRQANAWFDTAGYLAANPDVRAAGLDPLAHYMAAGWQEGRDPSTAFDTARYLDAYADIRAAGLNPLEHFLLHGLYEGRAAFGDGDWA